MTTTRPSKWLFLAGAALALLCIVVPGTPAARADDAVPPPDSPAPEPSHLVVLFRPDAPSAAIQALNDALGVTAGRRAPRSGLQVLSVPPQYDRIMILNAYKSSGLILSGGLDHEVRALDLPNDPDIPRQWHFENTTGGMSAQGAWELAANRGQGIVVAVIDTGAAYETYSSAVSIFPQHFAAAPDFAGRPIVAPYNFVNDTTHANDDNGHGTHVAGTILQTTGNGVSGAGVANQASLMPIKILDWTGSGALVDLVESIYYATDNGARVINMSLGFAGTGQPDADGKVCSELVGLADALEYAHSHNVVVVAATGNDGGQTVACPAAYPTVIAVGATRLDGANTFYSNQGYTIDITAPGGDPNVDQDGDGNNDGVLQQTFCADFITLLLADAYDQFCSVYLVGTSMASPHVAGAAALLLGEMASLNPLEVRHYLQTTARDRGATGWDQVFGHGALDARAAVVALQAGPPPDIQPGDEPAPPPAPGPAAPNQLLASALSASTIVLTWSDNSNDETGFKIERSTGDGSFVQIASVGANVTSFTNTGLAAGSTHYYRVRSFDASFTSRSSNVTGATTFPPPAAPSNLVTTPLSASSIGLSWTDNSSSETAFRIERSTNGTNFFVSSTVPANTTSFTSVNLSPATTYWFRVRSEDGTGVSAYSNVAITSTNPAPQAPSNLAAVATSVSTIALSWTDNASAETNYRVERSLDGSTSWLPVATLAANSTSYTNASLNAGTTYYFRVRALEGIVQGKPSATRRPRRSRRQQHRQAWPRPHSQPVRYS